VRGDIGETHLSAQDDYFGFYRQSALFRLRNTAYTIYNGYVKSEFKEGI
jgi:hypothetical protein